MTEGQRTDKGLCRGSRQTHVSKKRLVFTIHLLAESKLLTDALYPTSAGNKMNIYINDNRMERCLFWSIRGIEGYEYHPALTM